MATRKEKAVAFIREHLKGRPKPSAPRLGVKKSGSRYDSGGKVTRKKNV